MNTIKPTRAWTSPVLITFVFVLVFIRFWNHSVFDLDSFHYFAPAKFLIAEAFKQGTIFAWNPWQFLGKPFVGDIQSGWFYPLNILYVVLPFEPAHRLFILIHFPMAAIFMDLFLRGLGLPRRACLLGALAFALSGYMICQHANVGFLIGPAWAPLALYCMNRALRGSISWALGAGAVLAIQIFAGDPQNAAITAIIIAMFGLGTAIATPRKTLALAAVFSAGLFSFALSAVQLMPTYEMMKLSLRSSGMPLGHSNRFFFHPARLIELIWSMPFGTVWPEYNYWAEFALGDLAFNMPWSVTNYLGLPVVALAFIGVIMSRRRWSIGVGAGAVFFLLVAMGNCTPVYPWLHNNLPLFSLFRYPSKYMVWFSGFVVVAAALGLEKVRQWSVEKPSVLTGAATAYIIAAIAAALISYLVWPGVVGRVTGLGPDDPLYRSAVAQLAAGGKQFIVFNVVAGLVLFVVGKGVISVRHGFIVFLIVLVFDWWMVNVLTMPTGPPDIFDFEPVAARAIHPDGRPPLGQFRIFREPMAFRDTNPALFSYHPFVRERIWHRTTLFKNLDNMEGFENISGYNSFKLAGGFESFRKNLTPDVLELYNVRYIISNYGRKPIESVMAETIFTDRMNDLTIIRLPQALPRAWWVPSARTASKEDEAIKMLFSSNPRQTVILTTDENIQFVDPGGLTMIPAAITEYEPDRVVIETAADAPGWLVLSDRYCPGWNAEVDGRPATIYKANGFVRAVRLPPGKHTVDFRFQPMSLRLGGGISIFAWASVLSWWAFCWWRRKR